MNDRIAKTLAAISDFDQLAQFEVNLRQRGALSDEVAAAINVRSAQLGRSLIASRAGLDLTNLTPAEERIVNAVSEYAGIMKRKGKDATRTLHQLRNRGFIESAEAAVARSKPTQGFQTLKDEDLEDLSYEQIILDHPEEFSARAVWHASRTLGRPTLSDRPPARPTIPAQVHTENLLTWLKARAGRGDGSLGSFTNADAARAIGMDDLSRHGRAFGNIQSRLDFACYRAGLPPLGLSAESPFADAWSQQNRSWPYPVASMQRAARSYHWRDHDFDRLAKEAAALPGRAYAIWKEELRRNEGGVRAWAEGLEGGPRESSAPPIPDQRKVSRNPDWTREEHILGLDLYMRLRGTSYPEDHPEVLKLSATLQALAKLRGRSGSSTFRNANGVSMKMLNFRRLDDQYDGAGLPAGSKLEEEVWREYVDRPAQLNAAVHAILDEIGAAENSGTEQTNDARVPDGEAPYWVFVCNPSKWAIDRFLVAGIKVDTWGVRPADRDRFAPGQLGLVRVGVDRRSAAERQGRPPLEPGIYALCEVESITFPGTGADDSFWASGESREPGWPTVQIRYLRSYLDAPLSIARLRTETPEISHLLLDGFQAASFPISAADFHTVLDLLDEDADELPAPPAAPTDTIDRLAELEKRYLNACPEIRIRTSKIIERGPVGAAAKKAAGHKCQLCAALGMNPIGFLKPNGDPYVEAHHVMPVSRKEIGSLSASNIMTLCANHHRQIHYGGGISVSIERAEFAVTINGVSAQIPRFSLDLPRPASRTEPV